MQFFRNTPPLVQLAFFYFAVSALIADGARSVTVRKAPLIDNVGWAIISFSLFAARSMSRFSAPASKRCRRRRSKPRNRSVIRALQAYVYIILPLAFRDLPAGARQQSGQSGQDDDARLRDRVPELLYAAAQVWSEVFNVREMMRVLLVTYVASSRSLSWLMRSLGAGAAHSRLQRMRMLSRHNRSCRCCCRRARLRRRRLAAARPDAGRALGSWLIGAVLRSRCLLALSRASRRPRPCAGHVSRSMLEMGAADGSTASCSIFWSSVASMAVGTALGVHARARPDFAVTSRARRVLDGDAILPQRAVAGAAVLRDVPVAVRDCASAASIIPLPGLVQGGDRARAAGDGECRRNRARRSPVDSRWRNGNPPRASRFRAGRSCGGSSCRRRSSG